MKVFRFNKGDHTPEWVMHASFGALTFGCGGKLFLLENGDLVITLIKMKQHDCILKFDGVGDNLILSGGGLGNSSDAHFFFQQGKVAPTIRAREAHGIKNKAKCDKLPLKDPRVEIKTKPSEFAVEPFKWQFRD